MAYTRSNPHLFTTTRAGKKDIDTELNDSVKRDNDILNQLNSAVIAAVPGVGDAGNVEKVPVTTGTGLVWRKINESYIEPKGFSGGVLKDNTIEGRPLADACIETRHIRPKSIKTEQIDDAAVKSTQIHPAAVTTEKIADGAVTAVKLGALSVITAKIADLAISTVKLADGAVTAIKLAAASVTTEKVVDGAVTAVKIANGVVNAAKLSALSVITEKIADLAVTTAKLANGAVTAVKLAAGAVVAAWNASTAGTASGTIIQANTLPQNRIQNFNQLKPHVLAAIGSNGALLRGYGVASVNVNSGVYTVNFATAASSASYVVSATPYHGISQSLGVIVTTKTANSFTLFFEGYSNTAFDLIVYDV